MQLDEILENRLVDLITEDLPYAERLLTSRHEADADVVDIYGIHLAITTDTICEEIEMGLYDPYLAGWMTVTANLSDLAAVGARQIGMLLSLVLPEYWRDEDIKSMSSGIRDACQAHNCGIIGGDTNSGRVAVLGGTALGIVEGEPLTRRGMKPGDVLLTTGPAGLGNAFALARLLDLSGVEYRPMARISEALEIRDHASAAMDTSDGFLATVDELARINSVSIELTEDFIHPVAVELAEVMEVNPITFAAGIHGDFELVFSVPEDRVDAIMDTIPDIIRVGRVSEGGGVYYKGQQIPGGEIRNLYATCKDMEEYIEKLASLLPK